MLSTFFRLEKLDPGFDRNHVLLVGVDLHNGHYQPTLDEALFDEMLKSTCATWRPLRQYIYYDAYQ